jgi:hypothetical protein
MQKLDEKILERFKIKIIAAKVKFIIDCLDHFEKI